MVQGKEMTSLPASTDCRLVRLDAGPFASVPPPSFPVDGRTNIGSRRWVLRLSWTSGPRAGPAFEWRFGDAPCQMGRDEWHAHNDAGPWAKADAPACSSRHSRLV